MKNEYVQKFYESLKTFNIKAKDFYKGDNIFSIEDKNRLKAALLTGIIDFERAIRGTFGADLSLKDVDINKIQTMFPNACKNIFKVNGDLTHMGRFIEMLRNANAHAFLSKDDEGLFDYDFSYLQNAPKMDTRINYVLDGELTLFGIIYIILNLLRAESIAAMTKKEHAINVVAEGRFFRGDGKRFVNEISGVDLEIEIREDKPSSVVDSNLGSFKDKAVFDNDSVSIVCGSEVNPTLTIQCSYLSNELVVVKKGTLSKTYYKDDYTLKIENQPLFVELSNKLPPFVLVDYLYLSGITVFDRDVYEKLNNYSLLAKLNKPKYYVDKNIGLLLLDPDKSSDYRLISSVVSDGLISLFLSLEEYLYSKYGFIEDDSYSTLKEALNKQSAPYKVKTRIVALRNLVAHGYAFGDYSFIYKNQLVEFNLDFVRDSLFKLVKELKETNEDDYRFVAARVNKLILERIMRAKYQKVDEVCFAYLMNGCVGDVEEIKKKYSLIEHSFFDFNSLQPLAGLCYSHYRIIQVYMQTLNFPLTMIANYTSIP